MGAKITATFPDGRRRVLKSPEDGNFGIFGTIHGIAQPFNSMLGWCYETVKSKNKIKK